MQKRRSGAFRAPRKWNRHAQPSHRSAETSLATLFSDIHFAIAALDRDFRYLQVNKAFARILGKETSWFSGQDHFSLFPDTVLEAAFYAALQTGQAQYAYGKTLPGLGSSKWDWVVQPILPGAESQASLLLTFIDATAREQTQQALRQTQSLFAHLFETAPDAYVLTDRMGRILSINQEAERLFRSTRNTIVGQPVEVLIPESFRSSHIAHRMSYMESPRTRAMAAEQSHRLELMALRPDGTTFPAEVTLSPFRTEQSMLVLSAIRDLTERKSYEREIQDKTELVRLLQDVAMAANEASSVSDAFQFALNRLCKHLDWPIGHAFMIDQDASLSPMNLWCDGILERFLVFKQISDSTRFKAGAGMVGQVLETGQPVWVSRISESSNFIRKKEAEAAGLITGLAMPVLAGKEVVGVLEFFHERSLDPDARLMAILPHIGVQLGRVVERRRAEEALRKAAAQLRMVIVNLPVILWVVNREGRLIMLEGQGLTNSGIDPEMLLGQQVFDRMQNQPDLLEYIHRAMEGESLQTEITSATNQVYETFLTPFFDENWAVDGVIGLSFDVSARKRMEEELDEMKHRLLESVEIERNRLGQRLHDGPLQDLYGAFYQIQEVKNSLDEAGQETLGRALQTIQQVNATLRVICGELRPTTLVHLGLEKAIRSHTELLQERLGDGRVLHLHLNEDNLALPHTLRLGLFRIYQQLVSNAVRHSASRHIWVNLNMRPNIVLLEVQDNGQGFDVPKNFIGYVRKGQFGLASIQERVQALNGTLEVHSRPGSGTLVRVTVPRNTRQPNQD